MAEYHTACEPVLVATMRDVDQDNEEESPYECFGCGNVIVAEDNPGNCPDCATAMRNRQTPIE